MSTVSGTGKPRLPHAHDCSTHDVALPSCRAAHRSLPPPARTSQRTTCVRPSVYHSTQSAPSRLRSACGHAS